MTIYRLVVEPVIALFSAVTGFVFGWVWVFFLGEMTALGDAALTLQFCLIAFPLAAFLAVRLGQWAVALLR